MKLIPVRFFWEDDGTAATFHARLPEIPRLGDKIQHPHDAIYPGSYEVVDRHWVFDDDEKRPDPHPISKAENMKLFFVDVVLDREPVKESNVAGAYA